jgi:phospholipid/cholesterol/gamma-HCH transport system substrate-binding protein
VSAFGGERRDPGEEESVWSRHWGLIRILIAAGFSFACFGLLLYVWITFGGPIPLAPKSYRFTADFPEAITLQKESDVRVGGVSVGKVKAVALAPSGNATQATIELKPDFAPVSSDARAILRTKTLLGETYVELTTGTAPAAQDTSTAAAGYADSLVGDNAASPIPEDGHLADNGLADASIEVDSQYAPVPSDTRAILRQKTLLGETYVELTPGSAEGPKLAEDGTLPAAQVAESVQLVEIYRTFDAKTRAAFQTWMQGAAEGVAGRGADLSAAIANLEPFATDANRVLRVLDTQSVATSQLVRNTGVVFNAISERRGQLRGLIQNANTVFSTTAARNQDLADTFRVLPTFLDESQKTLDRVDTFAKSTDPLVRQLRPAARQLSPVLQYTGRLAPYLRTFFNGLKPLSDRSPSGLGALRGLLGNDLPPLLAALDPFTNQLQPILDALPPYKHEITAFLGNATAATQASNRTAESGFQPAHYLRTINPLAPETLAAFPTGRLNSNRSNPYTAGGGYNKVGSGGLESFHSCTGGLNAKLDPTTPSNPDFQALVGGDPTAAKSLFDRIKQFAFDDQPDTSTVPEVPCRQQAPFTSIGQIPEVTDYWHIYQRNP